MATMTLNRGGKGGKGSEGRGKKGDKGKGKGKYGKVSVHFYDKGSGHGQKEYLLNAWAPPTDGAWTYDG